MKKILAGQGVRKIWAVATSAVRSAANGPAFTAAMREETGISIRVIPMQEEAELAALSARRSFDMKGVRHAVVDIGGGSVEIVVAMGDHNQEIYSLDLGAIFLTESFLRRDPLPKKDFVKLRKHIDKLLNKTIPSGGNSIRHIIGSGGTMTTIANTLTSARGEAYNSVHGYEVLHSDVVHLLAMLRHKTSKERRSLPGLSPDRADIIVAGVTVVDRLMRHFNANTLKVSERGIREGLVVRLLQKYGLAEDEPGKRDWRHSVENFARSCHVDEKHAQQVSRISLKIFDSLARRFSLEPRWRELLEAAALLHDTGYLISYPKHHRHSYHLIRHAELYDFSPREREIMANVARYHRRALPKKKHTGYRALSPADRKLVSRLGGILRLADGLDRRRTQQVSGLRCMQRNDTFYLTLRGKGALSVEAHWGLEKGDLFMKAFDLGLSLKAGDSRARKTGNPSGA
jgi:exopolyphosphatase/guanosine-5'-triphosphate,3'-diphosphate pyrophosphatase